MQLQFLDSVWFSLHKKEDFYITLSWFFSTPLQASQYKEYSEREKTKQARKSWSRYNKKVEEDEVSCGSFVVQCSKVVCFCGCSNCRPLCFIFSYYRNHLDPLYTIHPSRHIKHAKICKKHPYFFPRCVVPLCHFV